MQQEHPSVLDQLREKNIRLQTQLSQVQVHLLEATVEYKQEQARQKISEDRALQQIRRAAAVNVEVIKANGALKQHLRLSIAQADELKTQNTFLRSVLQVRAEEDRSTIARLTQQLEAVQVQGRECRQDQTALQQQSTSLSESNSALGMLPVEAGRGKEDSAVQATANEVAGSAQPHTTKGHETGSLLSSNVVQQASTEYEVTVPSAGSMHVSASSMPGFTGAALMADVPRPLGSAPTGLMPGQPSNPDHLIACPSTDEEYEGLPDDTPLHISPFAVMDAASSSGGSSSAAVGGSMSTHKAGTSDRSSPAVHFAPPHLPESRHSKGLQQLWNAIPHTPLTVPSPCSMTAKESKQDSRQCAEQGHQPVLMSEVFTAVEGASQRSSMTGNATSEVPARAAAHSAGSGSTPIGGAESPLKNAEASVPQRRSGRSKPRVAYVEPKLGVKLRQGDAFTFGSAESIPRSGMRRRSVVPTGKGQLGNLRAPSDMGTKPLSDTGNHDIA